MTPTLLKAASTLDEKPGAETPTVGNSVHCVTEGLFPDVGHPKLHNGQAGICPSAQQRDDRARLCSA
jgi:hypothetical protein